MLSVARAVGGEARPELRGTALLAAEVGLAGTALLPAAGAAGLDTIPGIHVPAVVELKGAGLLSAVIGLGQIRHGLAFTGAGSCGVTASGAAGVERSLEGWAVASVSAWGDVEADDEETTLMMLGLPSEVLV